MPDLPGLAGVPYLTNSSMMAVDFLPPHLAIVGGSYVGLEFAQMYRRFGSRVTVIEMSDRLIPREDPDISAEVKALSDICCGVNANGIRRALSPENPTTPQGTFRAIIDRLDHLVETGITALELMPLADFPGRVVPYARWEELQALWEQLPNELRVRKDVVELGQLLETRLQPPGVVVERALGQTDGHRRPRRARSRQRPTRSRSAVASFARWLRRAHSVGSAITSSTY